MKLISPEDIQLITPPSSVKAIETALAQNPHLTSLPLPKPDILSPENLSQNTPTAEILRHPRVQAAITGDFLVLPCDLVCELPGESLVEAWMIQQGGLGGASLDSDDYKGPRMGLGGETGGRRGGLGVWFETRGEDSTKGTETDFMITTSLRKSPAPAPEGSLRPYISKLLYSSTTDTLRDITTDKKGFPIRHGLIRKHGKIKIQTTHRDAHIYLFPYWVLEMIKRNDHFESISEDVVGWWAKATWQDGLASKLHLREIFDPSSASTTSTSESPDPEPHENTSYTSSTTDEEKINLASMSSTQTSNLSTRTTPLASQTIPLFLSYIHPHNPGATSPLIRRVDNPHLLLHTSLHLASLPPTPEGGGPLSHTLKIASTPSPHTTIHIPTTLVAPNTTIATHAVIKSSVIGSNCVIEAGARITGSVVMDGVVVGEKSVVQGCILGRRCVLGGGCSLRECEVQEGYVVGEGMEAKGERFVVFEGLEEGDGEELGEGEGILVEE